jgi:hypothetical protein
LILNAAVFLTTGRQQRRIVGAVVGTAAGVVVGAGCLGALLIPSELGLDIGINQAAISAAIGDVLAAPSARCSVSM